MSVIQSPRLWTKNALAEELRIAPKRVTKLMRGVPPDGRVNRLGQPVGSGGYDAWYMTTAIPILYEFEDEPEEGYERSIDPELLLPKDRRDWYEGTKTRLYLEEQARNLIPASESRREMALLVQNLIAEFESLPDLLERNCGADPDMVLEAQHIVDKARQLAYERITDAEPAESA